MKKLSVYIASPYTLGDTAINVKNQMTVGNCLISLGFYPFIPLLTHFQHMAHPRHYSEWLEYDIHWCSKCDYVLRLPGISKGADDEVHEATFLDIPVAQTIPKLIELATEEYDYALPEHVAISHVLICQLQYPILEDNGYREEED